jgi:hypothetical protein
MPVPCARCQMPLPEWELATLRVVDCTSCGAGNEAHVFPAALKGGALIQTEVALEGEAACFDHPEKRAVAACQQCGRFVCQLCAVDFGGGTWCPSCVAAGAGAARSANPEAARTLYDSIALIIPLASLLLWPFTIVTGPGAAVFSIMKWHAPLSLVRRFRWRFVAAIIVGLGETAGWIWGLLYLLLRNGTKA